MLSVRTLNAPFFDVLKSPTRNATPLFSGTLSSQTSSIATLFAAAAQAALSVAVVNGETPLCSGTVDSTGRWSCRPQKALSDGSYLLVAVLTDGKGHFSGPSMARAVVIDTTPPNAPVLDLLASPSRKHRPVLSGTAEAASAVTVTDAGTGAALCEASANGAGAFSCRPERELAAGIHQFSATATDAAGNVSLPAVPVGVTISDVAPPPPTIDSPADGSEVEDSRPVLAGRTAAGTTVQVTLDGAVYAAQVAPDGQWSLLPSAALPFGSHHVSAAAIDGDQNMSEPAQSTFSTVESGVARGGCSSGGTPWPLLAVAAFLAVLPRRRARALALLAAVALPVAARAETASCPSKERVHRFRGNSASKCARGPTTPCARWSTDRSPGPRTCWWTTGPAAGSRCRRTSSGRCRSRPSSPSRTRSRGTCPSCRPPRADPPRWWADSAICA